MHTKTVDEKKCNKCGLTKAITEFYFQKVKIANSIRISPYPHCKTCQKKMTIACRAKNKKHYRDYRKVYRQTHVDQIRFNSWKSYHKNREQRLENSRKYWAENKERLAEKRREYAREYRRKNRERITASRRLYYLQNRQKAIDRAKESYYRRTAKHEPTN